MVATYHRQDVIGWLARRILQGPETIFEYHKDVQGVPPSRVERHLPPRLSLRTQASKRVRTSLSSLRDMSIILSFSLSLLDIQKFPLYCTSCTSFVFLPKTPQHLYFLVLFLYLLFLCGDP